MNTPDDKQQRLVKLAEENYDHGALTIIDFLHDPEAEAILESAPSATPSMDDLMRRNQELEKALITIRDECFSGSAYDIAVRALTPSHVEQPLVSGGLAEQRAIHDTYAPPHVEAQQGQASPRSQGGDVPAREIVILARLLRLDPLIASTDAMPRTFEYLLNAMEAAAQAHNPHMEGYADKRRAVFQHVEDLWDDYLRLLREKQDRLTPSSTRRAAEVDVPMIEAACEVLLDRQGVDIGGDAMREALQAAIAKASDVSATGRTIDWKQKYSFDLHNLVQMEKWFEKNHPDLLDAYEASMQATDGRSQP